MSEREWVLLNPGPANTTGTVRRALVMPDLCHREPECFEMMRRCRDGLVRLSGAGPGWSAVLFTGSGTAAVEAVVCSAVPRDRALVVVNNGVYGDRLLRIARAHDIPAEAVTSDIFAAADPAAVEAALRARPDASHVAVVHHETTTGLLNPVADIARVAARLGRRVIVDAMSSLFGERLDVGQDGIDWVAASANKCLQGIPGVAFVLGRVGALEALAGRPPRSVYLDVHGHWASQEQDNTPFTPAVQVLHAMEQAIGELAQEGVDRRIARYAENARTLRDGMAALGFEALRAARGAVAHPDHVPPAARPRLRPAPRRHEAAGLHHLRRTGSIRTFAFRVANMGTLTPDDMRGVVAAFGASLGELGVTAAGVARA